MKHPLAVTCLRLSTPVVAIVAALLLAPPSDAGSSTEAAPDLGRLLGTHTVGDGEPFRLEADFRLQGRPGKRVDGRYSLEWREPGRWVERIEYPGYQRVRVARDGRVEQRASQPVQPARVFDLERLLRVVPGPELELPTVDLEFEAGESEGWRSALSASVKRGDDFTVHASPGPRFRLEHRYRAKRPQPFRGASVPRELEYRRRGHVVARASIRSIEPLEGGIGPVEPPSGDTVARFAASCRPVGPEVVRFEQIPLVEPDEVFAATMVVGVDGRAHDLVVVRSIGPDGDRHYIDHLRQQHWAPARCGDVALDAPMLFTSQERFAIRIGDAGTARRTSR